MSEQETPQPDPAEAPDQPAPDPDEGDAEEAHDDGEGAAPAEPGADGDPGPGAVALEPGPDGQPVLGAENAEQVADLEKAQTAYLRKVERILGPGNMPPLCPKCDGTALDFSGGVADAEFMPSPDRERCPDCAGLGKVLSGSRVPGEEVLPCPGCQGAGHRIILGAALPQQLAASPQVVPAPTLPTAAHGGATWQGDPSIGAAG